MSGFSGAKDAYERLAECLKASARISSSCRLFFKALLCSAGFYDLVVTPIRIWTEYGRTLLLLRQGLDVPFAHTYIELLYMTFRTPRSRRTQCAARCEYRISQPSPAHAPGVIEISVRKSESFASVQQYDAV